MRKSCLTQCCFVVLMNCCVQRGLSPLSKSQQLTEQGPRRHHHWIGATETINRYERNLNYCLKSMFCLSLMLEVGQRVRQSSVASLYLDQKPGLSIAHDEKIHLAFELVAELSKKSIDIRQAAARW